MRWVLALALSSCGRIGFTPPGAADDDGDAATASDTLSLADHNIIFVTSTDIAVIGLTSLESADAECQTRAAAAGLPGTYIAWLSTSMANAASRLAGDGWVRPDGKPFARTRADLLAGRTLYAPNIDELGRGGPGRGVATGTTGAGTFDSDIMGDSCGDFTSRGNITLGDSGAGGTFWTDRGDTVGCASHPIFCLSIDHANPIDVTPPTTTHRIAFVSSQAVTGGTGVAGADALCQSDASAAGLPGTFLSLMATSTSTADSRFDFSGAPWYRVDGIPVVTSASELLTGNLLAPIYLTAAGSTYTPIFPLVSTGAVGPSALADQNCLDWTATGSNDWQTLGGAHFADGRFFDEMSARCGSTYSRVYCLQL